MSGVGTRGRQSGISLIEVLGAIAIGAVLLLGLGEMIDVALEDARGQQAAGQQAQLANAARRYIAANYGTLTGTAVSTVTPVTVATLKAQNFLPQSFSVTNSYQQDSCVLIRHAAAGRLDALVVTHGGTAIPERGLAAAAMHAGQGAGYISRSDPTRARGASWSLLTTDYRRNCGSGAAVLTGGAADAGHLASSIFYDGPGQLATDFLYRDAQADPALNRMNTPIGIGGAALVSAGAACGSEIRLAVESSTRSIMVCASDGTWTNASSWKDPAASHAALTAGSGRQGDVRIDGSSGRAFVYVAANGGAWGPAHTGNWVPAGVDQNGNLYLSGDLYAAGDASIRDVFARSNLDVGDEAAFNGMTIFYQDLWANSGIGVSGGMLYLGPDAPMHADASVGVHNSLTVEDGATFYGGMEVQSNALITGNATVDGTLTSNSGISGSTLRATTTANAGSACTTQGTIRQSSSGIPMVCRNVGGWLEFRYANGELAP